jgi:hypothetical protein
MSHYSGTAFKSGNSIASLWKNDVEPEWDRGSFQRLAKNGAGERMCSATSSFFFSCDVI